MRILWVKAGKLLPADTGGRLRSYHLLRQLARSHEVLVLTYYEGKRDAEYESQMKDVFPGAISLRTGSGSLTARVVDYVRHLWNDAPFTVYRYSRAPVRQRVERILADKGVDVAVCDFLAPSLNFPLRRVVPTVLFQHNVESLLWQRRAATERRSLRRNVYFLEAQRMRQYEARALRRFDRVIAVSEVDKAEFSAMAPGVPVDVVPTGVDVQAFDRPFSMVDPTDTVVFVGSMDWEPNVDGVEWFCQEVWPLVLRHRPGTRFQIVGRRPGRRIRALASDTVEVVGDVSSVAPYLHSAAVSVVPLRSGGGTRLKILEAFAARCAVVSTTVGAEGLPVQDGRDILLRDDASAFAAAVVALLEDSGYRRRMSEAARTTAETFDWSAVVTYFEAALTAAYSSRGQAASREGSGHSSSLRHTC
ncbi:MAG TPA: glycosyltransferase family 4 protein [Gemmatimonadaceae bacterium]|nr:glycosyltransferase family 4 protein [Gemmatimonadaceae bacterium]